MIVLKIKCGTGIPHFNFKKTHFMQLKLSNNYARSFIYNYAMRLFLLLHCKMKFLF